MEWFSVECREVVGVERRRKREREILFISYVFMVMVCGGTYLLHLLVITSEPPKIQSIVVYHPIIVCSMKCFTGYGLYVCLLCVHLPCVINLLEIFSCPKQPALYFSIYYLIYSWSYLYYPFFFQDEWIYE